jgi:hypothetical protein
VAGYRNGPATMAWVLKLADNGDLQWERSYDNAVSNAHAIRQTADGGYLLGGYRMEPGASPSRSDAFALRLDRAGDAVWYKTYALPESTRANDLELAAGGGFVLAGFADLLEGSPIRQQAWLLALGADGAIVWQLSYGQGAAGPSDSAAHAITASGSGYRLAGTTTADGAGSNDYWLVEVDTAGAIQAQHRYGGPGGETAVALAPAVEGRCLLAGSSASFSAARPSAAWLLSLDATRAITFDPFTNGRTGVTTAAATASTAIARDHTLGIPDTLGATAVDTTLASQDLTLTVATQGR